MTPEQFIESFKMLSAQEVRTTKRFSLEWNQRFPILEDDTTQTGFDRHYVYHVAWAARALQKIRPAIHYDFSSSLYLSATASAWFPVKFCDVRPADLQLDNLTLEKEDLTRLTLASETVESASCLHVVEHVGLGRYGDELDYDGDLKAARELKRVMRPGGDLLFAVPVGKESMVMFNAHRIYRCEQVLSMFADQFTLVELALIPDDQPLGLVYNPSPELLATQTYGCACFWFKKKHAAA